MPDEMTKEEFARKHHHCEKGRCGFHDDLKALLQSALAASKKREEELERLKPSEELYAELAACQKANAELGVSYLDLMKKLQAKDAEIAGLRNAAEIVTCKLESARSIAIPLGCDPYNRPKLEWFFKRVDDLAEALAKSPSASLGEHIPDYECPHIDGAALLPTTILCAECLEKLKTQIRREALEEAIVIIRKYLSYNSQRAVSWHEVNDCIEAVRTLSPAPGEKAGGV